MDLALSPSEALAAAQERVLRPAERATRGVRTGEIDERTLEAAQKGNRAAIERFVLHYQALVFAFLSRSSGRGCHVEDLAQEVFTRACRALPRFVRGEAKVSTWLLQIAVRLLQDRHKRRQPIWVDVTDSLRDERATPEDRCVQREVLGRVEKLVERMPAEQRVALVLSEFHGLSHAQIARATDTRVATVKTRLHRARKFLREGLRPSEEVPE